MSDIYTEGIIPHPGGKLLYRAASGLEKSMADVDGERLIGTFAEIIIDQWDPYRISYNNLPYLGYAMGVLLWEEGWSESTQREWIANQFTYKSLRGTQAGHEMALHYSGRDFVGPQGYTVQQAIRPPHGRKAFLRVKGVDQPLEIYRFTKTINGRTSIDYERVSIPGHGGMAMMCGDIFVNEDDRFVCAEKIVPQLVTVRIDGSYDHEQSLLHLDTVVPGLEPIDVRYERDSDVGWGNSFLFVNDWNDSRNLLVPDWPVVGGGDLVAGTATCVSGWIAHEGFGNLVPQNAQLTSTSPLYGDPLVVYADPGYDAARMLADRIFLHDPDIVATITGGISFVGVDYVSWPAYTADLMIALRTWDKKWSWFADEGYLADDNYFASPTDLDDFDRSNRAVVTSQALRDRVRVAYDPTRLIELRERAWPETTIDQQVVNLL